MSDDKSVLSIEKKLSFARLSKYEKYYKDLGVTYSKQDVIGLYQFNLMVSNKFFYLLNFFEILLRNAVVEAIELAFNCNPSNEWFNNQAFIRSLSTRGRNSTRSIFDDAKRKFPNSGSKIIPELKFVFWQKILVASYDQRVWQKHFTAIFPNAQTENRQTFYNWVDQVRALRNRITHHEPILFNRDLNDDLRSIMLFIYCRCEHTYSMLEPIALELENMLVSYKQKTIIN